MLTSDEIKAVIVERLEAVDGSCNSTHIDHTDGVLRGLIWAFTGNDPGTYLTKNTIHIFELLGIPAKRDGDRVLYETGSR